MTRFAPLFTTALAVAACGDGGVADPGSATDPASESRAAQLPGSFTLTGTSANGVDSLKAEIPVADATGLVTETMQVAWDKTLRRIAAAPITPQGWTVTYFTGATDDTAIAAPTTPAGWATVTRVRTTGVLDSLGADGIRQFLTWNVEAPRAIISPTFQGNSAGDGWDAFFDPDRTKVFNIHHHTSPSTVMCRNLTDSQPCDKNGQGVSPWPIQLTQTPSRPTGYIDPVTNKMWMPTSGYSAYNKLGWDCVNLATQARCNAYVAGKPDVESQYVAGGGQNSYDNHTDWTVIGRRLYALGYSASKLRVTCLDLVTETECAGIEVGTGDSWSHGIDAIGNNVYVLNQDNGTLSCFDSTTWNVCAAPWPISHINLATTTDPNGHSGGSGRVHATPDHRGVIENICADWRCFKFDGTPPTLPAGYLAYAYANKTGGWYIYYYSNSSHDGARVAWLTGSQRMACWNMATDAKCSAAFPITTTSAYSAKLDPGDDNCIWTNGDDGIIRNFRIDTGAAGCGGGDPRIQFKASVVIPRLGCEESTRVYEYKEFRLTAPTYDPAVCSLAAPNCHNWTSAKLTVKDSFGVPIAGWINLTVPTDGVINLQTAGQAPNVALTPAIAGDSPTFDFSTAGFNDTGMTPSAILKVVTGSPPQMCLSLNPPLVECPTTAGLATSDSANSTPTNVLGNASYTVGEVTTTYNEQTYATTGNATAPSSVTCGGTVSGTAKFADNTPSAGATVQLLDGSGNPILVNGQPVTTVTAANGTFSFSVWYGVGYQVKVGAGDDGVPVSATATSGGTGTTNASGGFVTSTTVTPPLNGSGTYSILMLKVVKWTVTVTPPTNGTITCTPLSVNDTQTFTCTITPAPGYVLSTFTDNGTNVIGGVTNGSYTSGSVTSNHTVTGTFKKDLGAGCGNSAECQGGICVDGVCCNTTCTGSCQACNVAGSAGTCSSTVSASGNGETDTSCDGVDNNCNGQKDEGFVGVQTRCGVGACAATGTSTCTNGVEDRTTGTCVAGNASPEVCDGVDNDCDQKTDQLDDSLEVAPLCANQAGECAGSRRTRCQGAAGWAACTDADYVAKSPFYSSVELCDSKDNNCAGGTDEGFGLGDSCSVGLGACTLTGTRVCLANKSGGCSVQPGEPANETCNAIDDNCDGLTDNVVDGQGSVCPDLDTAITDNPDARTASDVATFDYVDTVTSSNTDFECQLDGGEWTECDGGTVTYEELSNGSHTFLVRAVGVLGNVDQTPAYYAWIVDTKVPDTTVLSGPQNPSQSHTGDFVFGTNVDEPSAWWCAIDPVGATPSDDEWFLCDATYTWTELPDGPHMIWVYVVNEIGIADETPAEYAWVIDSTAPGTEVTVQPNAVTCDTTVTFAFMSPDDQSVTVFRCRLDEGDWTDCDGSEATYSELEDGPHVFSVASLDSNGNLDPTPATVTFVVDTKAPETTIEIGPQDPAQSDNAVFSFSSSEEGVTFYCRLDAGVEGQFVKCTSPMAFKGLREGPHHFEVYAADMGCLSDETPASWDWLIDTRFPETVFLATPPVLNGKDDKNIFVYEDPTDPQLTTFECKLDSGAWVACNDGTDDLGLLPVGTHTFTVRACDHVTETFIQCDPTPAVYTWQVTESPCPLDAQPPLIACAADLTVECKKGHGEVDLEAIAATATDECAPVVSGTTAPSSFPVGASPIVFQAADGNGNRSSCITMVTVADRVAPTITCPEAAVLDAPEDSCGLAYDLGKAVVADDCYGSSVVSFSNAPQVFGAGETVVTFTALDLGGNAATCTTKVTVKDTTPVKLTCEDAVDREAPADACSWTGTLQATAVDNCSVDAMVLERTNRYKIGTQDVEFSASDESGNTTTCLTILTVKDVTSPVIDCGEPTGPVPATVTAVATDACTAMAQITDFTCTKVAADGTRTAIDDVTCGVSFEGDTLTVTERLEDGTLEISYSVIADDPSENRGTKDCTVSFGADRDGDGIVDTADNCIDVPNTDQVNSDSDNLGDACDVCKESADPDQADTDEDGVGDACDNCKSVGNLGQEDGDKDGVGDSCDVCADVADPAQADVDSNGMGDLCQDTDKDEVLDVNDNCPLDANLDQLDFDEDGVGNPCDETDAGIVAKGGVEGCAGGAAETGVALAMAALGLFIVRRRKV